MVCVWGLCFSNTFFGQTSHSIFLYGYVYQLGCSRGMLERVALRLETCGRRLLRGQLKKRMLHSAFWVHGAGELDLSSAAFFGFGLSGGSKGLEGYEEESVEGGWEKDYSRGRGGAVKDSVRLEFLYPKKTLAFLRYLSASSRRDDHEISLPGKVFSHACKRLYTTGRKGPRPEVRFPEAEKEPEPDDQFISLPHLRSSGKHSMFDAAWYHYLQEKDDGNRLSQKGQRNWVLSYLENSDRRIDKERIVTMFQWVPFSKRMPDEYRNIVHTLLDLDMLEAAFLVLENNVSQSYSSKYAGFERFIAHCIGHNWDMAVKAWELLEGCPPDHYNTLDTHMVANLVPNFKEKFLDMVETKRGAPSEQRFVQELLRGALVALTRTGLSERESTEYQPFWDAMQSLGMKLLADDYEAILFHLYRHHNFTQATDLYLEYRNFPGCRPNNSVLNAALRAFREQSNYRGMQMVFDDWFAFGSQPDQQAYYIIMREMARHGEAPIVRELVDQFFDRFRVENILPFNHLMQAHTVRGELDEVVKVFHMVREKGLQPDTVCFNIMINAHAKAFDVDGAFQWIQEMTATGLKPDVYTYTTLISMASERGDVENTQRMFNEAQEAGFEPNYMMYAALIQAHVEVGDIGTAESIVERVEEQRANTPNAASTTQLWNNLLTGYAWKEDSDKLNEAYHRMREARVPFDEYTYGILMHSLCLVGKVEAAENILRVLREEGFQPNEIHYSIIMVGYMRRRDLGKVWDTFRDMSAQKVSPYSTSLAVLIEASAFVEHAKWRLRGGTLFLESAEEILAEVSSKTDVLDLISMDPVKAATPPWIFTPLVSIYGKEGLYQHATDMFEAFLNLSEAQRPGGTKPSLKMYIALMNAHMGAGNIEGVRSVWEYCKRLARKLAIPVADPLQQSTILWSQRHSLCIPFTIFIKAMAKADDLHSIDVELHALIKAGYEFDNNLWNAYVQAFTIVGDLSRAFIVCESKLMPGWPARKSYYHIQESELKGEFPIFYPFIRTLEALTAELRQIENKMREGNRVASGMLKEYERLYPRSFEACENLLDKESRIAKEIAHRVGQNLARDGRLIPWGPVKRS